MNALDFVSNCATIFTILSFASGLSICVNIYRKGSTADISSFPFIAGILCTTLWLSYGLLLHDVTMIFVNIVGVVLQCLFLLWYVHYSPVKKPLIHQILMMALFFAILYVLVESRHNAVSLTGTLACIATLVFCGAPLVLVAEVIRAKSTEKLPFILIFNTFGMSLSWFIYGFLTRDPFVQLPNGVGALISGVQLALFALYPNKSVARWDTENPKKPIISSEIGVKDV